MSAMKVRGEKGTRGPVELFGARNEAEELGARSPLALSMVGGALKACAGRAMFCPVTGQILDYRTVVVVTSSTGGVVALSPRGWVERGAGLVEAAGEAGATLDVLTWRHVQAVRRAGGAS
jgi:hypothetical protein